MAGLHNCPLLPGVCFSPAHRIMSCRDRAAPSVRTALGHCVTVLQLARIRSPGPGATRPAATRSSACHAMSAAVEVVTGPRPAHGPCKCPCPSSLYSFRPPLTRSLRPSSSAAGPGQSFPPASARGPVSAAALPSDHPIFFFLSARTSFASCDSCDTPRCSARSIE